MALDLLKLQKMFKCKTKRLNCSLCHWWSCKRRLSRIKCLSPCSRCALLRCWTYFNLCVIWNGIRATPVHALLQHFCMCHSCAVSMYLYSDENQFHVLFSLFQGGFTVQKAKNGKETLQNYAASHVEVSYQIWWCGRIAGAWSNSSNSLSPRAMGEQRGGIVLEAELSSAGVLPLCYGCVRSASGLRSIKLVLQNDQSSARSAKAMCSGRYLNYLFRS